MTEKQQAAQAVDLAGRVPQMLRRLLAGRLSDTRRKQLEEGLASANRAYRTVRRRYAAGVATAHGRAA